MSEHERPDEPDDAVLDANIERLLSHAQRRPEVPSEARARMLAGLREAVRDTADERPGEAAGLRAVPERRRPGRAKARRRLGAATLVVALAAAVLLAWVLGLGGRLLERDGAAQLASYDHHELGAREVTLADGSRALLRSGTELEELGPRHLRLVAGEVLLDVREAAAPLLVETPQGRALVLGTRVLLRSDAGQTLAAVFRGQATVESSTGAASSLLLRAGEQALLRSELAPERIAGRRLSFEIDWARELLAPDAELGPVRRGNLVARVPRWTGQVQASPEWPLPMRELNVDVHVEDGHVRATIDQTFFNHLERDLEGVYQFPLPPEAAISRLAMYVDGQRMEAGVVSRDRGRDIYEQIVHRRRDPALLEWMQGNLFQVRIFPLPGRTEKRVLLSYTAALDELYGRGQLRVPIPELDLPVARVNYRVRVVGGAGRELSSQHHAFEVHDEGPDLIAEFRALDHRVGADIVATLAGEGPGLAPPQVEHHRFAHADGRRHVGLRLRPELGAELGQATAAPARDWVILFDSSASRGPAELEAQRRFLLALLDHLDDGDRVGVLGFDSRVQWASSELELLAGLDREALELWLSRRAKVGLGATDLGAALDAGIERLTTAAAPVGDGRERVATVLYLGDGLGQDLQPGPELADPGAYVDALSQQLRAAEVEFVGVSFGPRYDAPALARLAAAGDGLHLHLAEGEPISWRALELLTTLATTRVLDLEATLVDAQGRAIAQPRTHADARSLAEGETLEVLAELGADDPDPVAVELRGRADGQDWHQRIELPHAADEAGWIPRAWARAHVGALSSASVEQHAAEITKLGLEHFLVTPTTSLLVLESEKMYRDFDVHRPPADGWAHYPAPDRIEVVREGVRTEAGHGQYVVREPVPMLVDYSNNGLSAGWGNLRTRGPGPSSALARPGAFGLGGLGLRGTGRGGGGTGFGFGVGGEGTTGLGEAGRIGEGSRAGFGARGRSSRRASLTQEETSRSFGGFVSRELGPVQWSGGLNRQQATAGDLGDTLASDARFASTIVTGAFAPGHGGGGFVGAQPWPQARHNSSDSGLDDLGELAPALFEEPFDLAREQLLLTGLDGTRGSVSEAAAELIRAARAAQADARYELPEGGTLDIDAEGRFAVVSERWGFLDEHVIYDGEQLRADYPELGLSVARAVGPTSPALLSEWVPWMVPRADHLAHFYDVTRSGPRTLELVATAAASEAQPEQPRARLEVELDSEHRVVALRAHVGQRLSSVTEFRWTDEGVTLLGGQHERKLARVGPARAVEPLAAPQLTKVSLPLPSPADLELALDAHSPGDEAWLRLQHQRLAGFAALADHREQLAVLEQIHAHTGRVVPGELVLAGAALRFAQTKRGAAILAGVEGPIASYLRATLGAQMIKSQALAKLGRDDALRRTPVGFMASYRTLLREAERGPEESTLRSLQTFLRDYRHPTYAYIATLQIANRWWSKYARKSAAWLSLAEQDNRFEYVALHQAGLALYQHGRNEEAAEIFERSFRAARADETMPIVDSTVQYAMTQARGEAGWQLAWTRLRERVAASGDPLLAMRFLAAAQQLGQVDEAQRIIGGLDPSTLDPELALALFDALLGHGRMSEAGSVLRSLLAREGLDDAPALLLRASLFAEQQGRLDEAAATLEQAMVAVLEREGMGLGELRQGFARLFDLRARLARPLAAPAADRAAALEAALSVADRWRLEDPDNPEIDRLCAQLLWSLGHDDEAWRHLSSTLDRHPAEGQALAWVADALERGADLERADRVWARAIAVEATNPLHRLRRAQNLLATGHEREAASLLAEIESGEWQPRFVQTVAQARRLAKTLDRDYMLNE
ncbi:Vault protein inter-alpha-trypsin [Enhygromyxa salina]|uniref:Vault protein inter-alpha-trypsin n=1 Tax=Enhygromyxa salina TaxID=215803 RepID=A0A2S9XY67_9BACT|nr:VIT domain-containing protein [Enhygromyxa salina]PRP97690.1 Vault protein inter-alpha-trypsin [Enhygromyxa salina]